MILNKAAETLEQSDKEALQSQKLLQLIERTYEKNFFYQKRMLDLNLTPSDIQCIQDLYKLPFTTSADLSNNYPCGFLTIPVSGVARFEQSIDSRISSGFTTHDLILQQELIARSLVACYITTTSVMYVPKTASISARALEQSAEMLGVTVIASQSDDDKKRLATITDFGVTTLFTTPDALISFADFLLNKAGTKFQDLPLKNILCETQFCTSAVQKGLSEKFHIPIYTLYGRSDIMSLGIAGECFQQQGLHIHDDHFFPEIINPTTGEILYDHQPGELVLTTLSRQATPLIRYRTGQKALLIRDACICGRTSARIIFL